jgi:hypothetical protein
MMINGKQAWAIMAAFIVLYEATCKKNELLSEQYDRWLVSHPVTSRLAVAAVACHLINAFPPEFDLISMGFTGLRVLTRRIGEARR